VHVTYSASGAEAPITTKADLTVDVVICRLGSFLTPVLQAVDLHPRAALGALGVTLLGCCHSWPVLGLAQKGREKRQAAASVPRRLGRKEPHAQLPHPGQPGVDCVLCLDPLTHGCVKLKCGHVFHRHCMCGVRACCPDGPDSLCPCCRAPLSPEASVVPFRAQREARPSWQTFKAHSVAFASQVELQNDYPVLKLMCPCRKKGEPMSKFKVVTWCL
jgi:hypothetical protein